MHTRPRHSEQSSSGQSSRDSRGSVSGQEVLQSQRREVVGLAERLGQTLGVGDSERGAPKETPPSLAPLYDEQFSGLIINRASSPYQNTRARVQNLSIDATSRNCLLELLSGEMFELLAPVHREIVTRCAKNPDAFPAADYDFAPYALGPGRWNGDLFASELSRPNIPCRTTHIPGSPPRIIEVGGDAPYGFLLMHKDAPIAAVSYVVGEGPTLFVVMTQRLRQSAVSAGDPAAAKMHEKAAKRLHLKDTLLEVCSSIADTLGCASITYQGAKNNRWVHDMVPQGRDDGWSVSCVPRMRFEDALETYDTFCQARGFTADPISGNFVKPLTRK